MLRHITHAFVLVLLTCTCTLGQSRLAPNKPATTSGDNQPSLTQAKPQIPGLDKRPKMSEATRMQIIQAINAEFARTRKNFPIGFKDITLTTEGKTKPDDARLYQLAMTTGAAAKIGDRIQITNIIIHEKSIYLEINGGPKKKTKWYQRVTISGMGGGVTPGGDPNQAQPTGAALSLEFKDHVPELTGPELKQLLDPVFDFSVKTAVEVYLETVPPKVKDAIKKHEVLVGMNRDMVIMAKDRPPQKLREKDDKGIEYEEWIYGAAPQDVTFIRFVGDEVTEVKIMKVSGEKILKTEKEVDVTDGVVSMASATARSVSAASGESQVPQETGPRPSLKRTGEEDDPMSHQKPGPPPQRQSRPGDPTDPSGMPPGQPLPPGQMPPSQQPPN
jgi:hypothetical protein